MSDFESLFDELIEDSDHLDMKDPDPVGREKYIRGPFYGYMGCKYAMLDKILPLLPKADSFIEVFGGTGTVLLNRPSSKIEVFNDRNSGVVSFFRALREDPEELIRRIELTPYSREDFVNFKMGSKNKTFTTDMERAHAWYCAIAMSYAGNTRTFQRWRDGSNHSMSVARLHERLPFLGLIRDRFQSVIIENLDWRECIDDYDQPGAVFYLDPPYVDADVYSTGMTRECHHELCSRIKRVKGTVVLSGVPNDIYSSFKWDFYQEWPTSYNGPTWMRYECVCMKF